MSLTLVDSKLAPFRYEYRKFITDQTRMPEARQAEDGDIKENYQICDA